MTGSSTAVDIFFPTYSGGRITLLNPDPTQIRLQDIALGLASNPRWAGQTDPDRNQISGAEHSVRMSHLVPTRVAPLALMHDAAEYAMCDVSRPVRSLLREYTEMEDRFLFVILKKFGIQNLMFTPEASWMWNLDKVFPLVEVKFSELFPSQTNISRMNGQDDPKTGSWVDQLGSQTMEDYPEWGWTRKVAYNRFLMRAKQLGISDG